MKHENRPEQSPLLVVKGLKKYYTRHSGALWWRKEEVFKAVDQVSFELNEGSILGIVGESGSGKSTTVRSLMRLIEPTEGKIYFAGQRVDLLKKEELRQLRTQMQIVFQDPYGSLNPRKTIEQILGEPLIYHGISQTDSEKKERIVFLLEQVGLSSHALSRYPHQFSGGQQQRISIARAISLQPKMIVLDEAVSALDISIQAQILNLLLDLQQKLHLSYLFISHDLSVIRHLCDRIIVMYQGKIVENRPTEDLFSCPENDYTKILLESIPKWCRNCKY